MPNTVTVMVLVSILRIGNREWHREVADYHKGDTLEMPGDEAIRLGSSVAIMEPDGPITSEPETGIDTPLPDISEMNSKDAIALVRNTTDTLSLKEFMTMEREGKNRISVIEAISAARDNINR